MVCCICCQERPCIWLPLHHKFLTATAHDGHRIRLSSGTISRQSIECVHLAPASVEVRCSGVRRLELQFALMAAAWLHSQGMSETLQGSSTVCRCGAQT